MAIPSNIETAIAGNAEVLEFVKGLDTRASLITPEIEADLPKLGEYKAHSVFVAKLLAETKAKDPESVITDFKNLVSIKNDLTSQRDQWKADGKGKDSPEYRALLEQIEANKTATQGILDQLKAANDKTVAAESAKRETDLEAAIISAGAKLKARNPKDEFILLKAKGLTGYKEDGTPFFNKLNEKGEKVAVANADELMNWHLNTDKTKIDASGKSGTGADHRGGAGEGQTINTREQARAAFKSSRLGT